MADPWQCPQCRTWIRGDVAEHRCPPDTAQPARVTITGGGGGGLGGQPGSVTVTGAAWPQTWTSSGSSATMPGVAVNYPGRRDPDDQVRMTRQLVEAVQRGLVPIHDARRILRDEPWGPDAA